MTRYLRLEKSNRTATLLIDRPEKKNAFLQEMWSALPGLVAEAMADDAIRLLVLRAAGGGAFCAGADIGEFGAQAGDAEWGRRNQSAIRDSQYALARAPKPTIALIEGDCVGGGCGLAIACDLRIAGTQARLGITPARLGIVYSLHDTKLLVDLVGPAQAKRILFTAQLLNAEEAHRIGLVDILAAAPETALTDLSDAILGGSPHSIAGTKRNIARILAGQSDDDDATLAEFRDAFTNADYQEGVAAFLNKRKPDF